MNNDKIISELNTLLKRNYDSEKGYHKAAEHVDDVDLKRLFEVYSDQRYHFGHDIKGEIKKLGGEPDKGDSLKAKAHRTWMDIKSIVNANDNEAMLEECIRGEKAALENYREVLNTPDIPDSTKLILHDHLGKIEESLYQIKELEEKNY